MKEKITKEVLLKENAILTKENRELSDILEEKRKQLSITLGLRKGSSTSISSIWSEPFENPSWEQIFVEIGKLLEIKANNKQFVEIEELYRKVRDLETKLIAKEINN